MSELQVNKIGPRTGTTLTLGESGQTIELASGATAVGFEGITRNAGDPAIDTNPAGGVGTVWLNTTSGEMFSLTDATAGANVWTNIGDGADSVPDPHMTATGGTITADGDYMIHTFTSSSNFVVGVGGSVEYLVIAGGGGGSQSYAGGGGAGGYLTATGFELSASTTYEITVGAGGAGHPSPGIIGNNSVFSTITSVGGGRGGYTNGQSGTAGGSGGGGSWNGGAGGAGTVGQGNAGGAGTSDQYGGAGGGGAGTVGLSNSGTSGGAGGNGLPSSINGTTVFRAGGGGGGANGQPGVGVHGGGTGEGSAAVANKGGGGGGAWNGNGQNGGSGVVIIRYKFQ